MRFVFSLWFIVLAGLVSPVAASSSPGLSEDSEGSGIDVESSGSGDWSDPVSPVENIDEEPEEDAPGKAPMDSEEVKPPADIQKGTSTKMSTSGFVFLENGRHYLEKEEVLAGMIAGVLMGAAIGAAIAGILIHKWKKREDEGGLLGKRDFT
ncbi:hypothetical protein OJAV_G00229100 [Oryzias javanicus]|uniref:Syndecan/Neurexin domain-containing protein n=1 Tax=Oryzias javanicus TaxID=123683 RepID=A0A437BZ27_ORYJA|nr:hypothetical protein OJAV_G00229100 [Oryzias javanicus]